jgi:hypothetical protein
MILNVIYKGKETYSRLLAFQLFFYRVKQAAYTTYTDVKNRSMLLMKNNVEKVKVLDIYIDLQSTYFLLPENGIYYE